MYVAMFYRPFPLKTARKNKGVMRSPNKIFGQLKFLMKIAKRLLKFNKFRLDLCEFQKQKLCKSLTFALIIRDVRFELKRLANLTENFQKNNEQMSFDKIKKVCRGSDEVFYGFPIFIPGGCSSGRVSVALTIPGGFMLLQSQKISKFSEEFFIWTFRTIGLIVLFFFFVNNF